MTIFAAAAIPIMIMGGILEIGKLVTAVWLHRYWRQATWWLKTYLTTAVLVLMFITSMGIFGFLSKAHIEQTASAQEGIAQLERIETEITRQEAIITRAEQRITDAESSVGEGNEAIQAQIDREQERIDSAYTRIQPAIDEQNAIIEAARAADAKRTEPYEQQLTALDEELRRLDAQANEYESRISNLTPDTTAVDQLLEQIATLEENIVVTTNRLQSNEPAQVRAGQATIGVNDDGLFGGNTRRALASWVQAQQDRIAELQSQAATLRQQSQQTVDTERTRLTNLVANIRGPQTEAIKARQLEILATIDSVRATESPAIQSARDEIARIRAGADAQIAQSNTLIQSLRESLTVGKDTTVEQTIDEQQQKIAEANNTIDTLTEERYVLEAEYRKLEAEVGPVKYIAEFVYGERADTNLLEEAVRWVILIIIFVFDPLAVLLLIASQYTFELHRKRKDDQKELLRLKEWNEYERKRAQRIIDNPGYNPGNSAPSQEEKVDESGRSNDEQSDRTFESGGTEGGTETTDNVNNADTIVHRLPGADDDGGNTTSGMDGGSVNDTDMEKIDADADATIRDMVPEDDVSVDDATESGVEQAEVQSDGLTTNEAATAYTGIDSKKKDIELLEESEEDEVLEERKVQWQVKESDISLAEAKAKWKASHPDETIKFYKTLFLKGKIDILPWESLLNKRAEETGYIQNSEQNERTLFNRLRSDPKD
jgi:hypothetical protein